MIDNRLTFREHLTYVSGKCARTTSALALLLPNLGGPICDPIWGGAMSPTYMRDLKSVLRRSAFRLISAYSTVSTDAALVIAGTIPVHIADDKRSWIN